MSAVRAGPRGGHSLQRRLLSRMAAGYVLLLLIVSVLLWGYARAAADRTQDLLLAGAALAILERSAIGPDGPTVDLPNAAMEILSLNPVDRVLYRVHVPGGPEITGAADLPLPADAAPDVRPAYFDAAYGGSTFRFVRQARQLNAPTGREWIAVQIGQTVEARTAQRWSFFLSGMLGLAAVSLVGLGCVWLAIRAALAPLRQIAADLKRRDPGDLTAVADDPPREVRGLVDAINGFIVRLGQNRALTEGFIADVAHQTRTSLSALQGHLSLAAEAEGFERMRGRVARAEAQAGRTVRLTNQLLANAMVMHRSDRASLQPLALKPLVRDALAELLRDSRMRSIALSFEGDGLAPGADMTRGDGPSIREALRNLVDNAARHGPPDNTIVIALREEGRDVLLSVEDAGPGIAEADLPRATDRFTSLAEGTRGSGLGLSIVRAVADGHGGRLDLGRSPLGGLRATLAFPRLAALLIAALLLAAPEARAQTLTVHSATDEPALRPLIDAFEARNPDVTVAYREFQTLELHSAMLGLAPEDRPDLVISSAMDLQVELVNRGMSQPIALPAEVMPPGWATWRSELFGFTFEPAAVIYDRRAIDEAELPRNHRDLARFVRENEARLMGRIGGYDIGASGIGYLFATQDSLQGPQAQRLIEVLGRAGLRTFCCTSDMVAATQRGELALAFNVIGSYAAAQASDLPEVGLHFFDDYNLVMTRTAFVPKGAPRPELAARFLTFLLSSDGQRVLTDRTPLVPLDAVQGARTPVLAQIADRPGAFLPIRLNLGLLTFLDRLKRDAFLSAWTASLQSVP